MPSTDVVEVVSQKHLSSLILGLEFASSDGHDALVGSVVYVAIHGGPFDMVVHDPSMFEIPAKLHAPNKFDPTTKTNRIFCSFRHPGLKIDYVGHTPRV